MAQACYPNTRETEAGGLFQVIHEQHSDTLSHREKFEKMCDVLEGYMLQDKVL